MWTSKFASDVLEAFNAFWGVVALYLAFYFTRIALEDHGGVIQTIRDSFTRILADGETTWRDGSLAAATLFWGEFTRSLVIWSWRHFGMGLRVPILTISIFVTCTGALCFLRVYSPQAASRRRAIILMGVAGLLAAASVLSH